MKSFLMLSKGIKTCNKESLREEDQLIDLGTMMWKGGEGENKKRGNVGIEKSLVAQM